MISLYVQDLNLLLLCVRACIIIIYTFVLSPLVLCFYVRNSHGPPRPRSRCMLKRAPLAGRLSILEFSHTYAATVQGRFLQFSYVKNRKSTYNVYYNGRVSYSNPNARFYGIQDPLPNNRTYIIW